MDGDLNRVGVQDPTEQKTPTEYSMLSRVSYAEGPGHKSAEFIATTTSNKDGRHLPDVQHDNRARYAGPDRTCGAPHWPMTKPFSVPTRASRTPFERLSRTI